MYDRGQYLVEGVEQADGSVVFEFFGVTLLKDRGHVGQHYITWGVLFHPAQVQDEEQGFTVLRVQPLKEFCYGFVRAWRLVFL